MSYRRRCGSPWFSRNAHNHHLPDLLILRVPSSPWGGGSGQSTQTGQVRSAKLGLCKSGQIEVFNLKYVVRADDRWLFFVGRSVVILHLKLHVVSKASWRNVYLLFWKFQTNNLFNLFVCLFFLCLIISQSHNLESFWFSSRRSVLEQSAGTTLPVESFQFQCWQIYLNLLLTTEELKEQYVPGLKVK